MAFCLLRHVLEGVGQFLLAEGQLAVGPDLGILDGSRVSEDILSNKVVGYGKNIPASGSS